MKHKPARRGLVRLATEDLGREAELPLFLDRFDAAALRREFHEAGIVDGLARRGYAEIAFELTRDENEHRLLVRADAKGDDGLPPLVELRCAEQVLLAKDVEPRPAGFDVLSVLAIRWLAMQDPRGRFAAERPPLPGQGFPGLGLMRPLILRIHAWAQAWGKDALVNVPEYFHNAVLYSALYRFATATRQGEFEALLRDLPGLGLAAASAALAEGRVRRAGQDGSYRWEPAVMLVALTDVARAWLEAPEYAAVARRAREAAHFHLEEVT